MTSLGGRGLRGPRRAIIVIGALVAGLLAPVGPAAQANPGDFTTVIVALADPPALAEVTTGAESVSQGWARARSRTQELRAAQQALLGEAERRDIEAQPRHRLTAATNALVLRVPAGTVERLRGLPGVAAVYPDQAVTAALADSRPVVGAPQVWQQTDPAGEPVTGTGVTVAVLDTGIDYQHPDLGGGFGPGHKVVAGYDFVNDDPDPMDDHGHGTHVAGIVAADGAVRGVAPDATLTGYKVLDQFGNGLLSDVLAGLDAAVDPANPHRADVVNLSLSMSGDGTDPLASAASAAAQAGVVVVAAAGNTGPFAQTVASPAAAPGVLAVGASATGVRLPRVELVDPVSRDLRAGRRAFTANPTSELELPVVDIGTGLPGSYDQLDVTGAAVLIEDPGDDGLAFAVAEHAQQRGAAAALFYVPDLWGGSGGGPGLPGIGSGPLADRAAPADPAALADPASVADPGSVGDQFATGIDDGRLETMLAMQIPGASAALLQEHLAAGEVRVATSSIDATDLLADFSARGPSATFTLKPELVAPGVEILSTLPSGGYGRASGTSMAAPHVAAGAALLRQLRPQWPAEQLAAALVNSAAPVAEYGPLAQGAGRLDLPAAAELAVTASPPALSLGLADQSADQLTATTTVTLANPGPDPVDLVLSVDQHGPAPATVTLAPDQLRLAPGESAPVEVRLVAEHPDRPADLTGWVSVAGDAALSVPYAVSARPLDVHITPDPAPPRSPLTVFLLSAAELAAAPSVTVDCPGSAPQPVTMQQVDTRQWRGTASAGDQPGLCLATASGTADLPGEPVLMGERRLEVAAAAPTGGGAVSWQPVGPNAEAGRLAFGDDRHRMSVLSYRWPSLFVTDDRLQTWRELRTMPVGDGVPVAVATHPDHGGTIYAAVNSTAGDPSYRGQVLLTRDGGASWQRLPGRDVPLERMALDATGEWLAISDAVGLRVTGDQGANWRDLPGAGTGVRGLHWIDDDLYVASNSGLVVFRGAATGEPAAAETLFQPGVLGWAELVAGDAGTILVTAFPQPWIYASYDGGETFEQVLQTTGTSFQRMILVGDEVYALNSGNLWLGANRGADWQPWGAAVSGAVSFDLGQWPRPHPSVADQVYISTAGAGLYAASEPGGFTRTGIPAAEVFSLAVARDATGGVLIAGTFRDTYRTALPRREVIRPSDLEWQSSGGEGTEFSVAEFVATSPADPSIVYKAQPDPVLTFSISRSTDGGASWHEISVPSGTPTSMLVHPAEPDRIYVGYDSSTGAGLVVSNDGGDSWHKVDQGRAFLALAGDPSDPDRIWAGDRDGLYQSTDGGLTFTRTADIQVSAIAVDPADPRRLAIGGRSLHYSHDGGQTVSPAQYHDLDLWIGDLVFGPDGRIYAAARGFHNDAGMLIGGRGVLVSLDGGASWQQFGQQLANRDVTSLALTPDGQHLYAGTMGGSVHRIRLAGNGPLP